MKRSDFTLCLSLISLGLKNGFGHNQEFSAGRLIRQSAYACRYCIHLQLWASCLSPIQVSFRDLGWQDFIARPDSCQTNFCAGKCLYPLNTYHNTTKHSYIQSIVNHYNPEVVPPPCCAPTQLRRLSVIYTEGNNGFTMQHWDDMIAESCGCV